MAKKESSLINMVLTLFVITLISGVSLGYINELTQAPKAATQLAKKLEAIKEVVPEFDNNPAEEMYKLPISGTTDSLEFYPATKNGEFVGVAITSYTNSGFSGLIKLMVGLKPDGTIHNISVLEQKETPGLGTKMEEPKFKNQFLEKDPNSFNVDVKQDGGDVDAITAATISSRAFCIATQLAYDVYKSDPDASSGATKTE